MAFKPKQNLILTALAEERVPLARLSGFDVHFDQNPCKFKPRVPKVFTTGAVLMPGLQRSHGAVADRVMITATALATFGIPARAGCTAT